jgi:hypothetical protein
MGHQHCVAMIVLPLPFRDDKVFDLVTELIGALNLLLNSVHQNFPFKNCRPARVRNPATR